MSRFTLFNKIEYKGMDFCKINYVRCFLLHFSFFFVFAFCFLFLKLQIKHSKENTGSGVCFQKRYWLNSINYIFITTKFKNCFFQKLNYLPSIAITYQHFFSNEYEGKHSRRISIRRNDRRFRREIYLSMRIDICL